MSNTVKLPTCPKCGAPIPTEAPQGLCPKCVLLGAATATEHGVPATATSEIPSIERIAAAFPQLEIVELVGRGGMGFVFKARQPHLDRFVALKLLPDKLAKDAQFAERFNREGRVLAKLNHPNIVSVFDFGQSGGFYYLQMEYVDGVNLRQAMRAGRFSPAEALTIVPKVCEALQYAHEQGILHRDIKPENILLDAKGRVKIADFGIAKLVGEDQPNITLTNTGAALGTPHYMAPEQLEKPSTVDHRADIYSLGVVFYEMLTGELPIGRFAAPSSKTPVNTTVDDVVFRALEKDRERRFQSAGEMKTQVEHLGGGEIGAEPETPGLHGAASSQDNLRSALPSPRWLKPAAIAFIVIGATAVPPTLISLGTTNFDLNLFMMLALTGVALLNRNATLRRVALIVNSIGLLLPWLTVLNVGAAMRTGTLAFNWQPTFAGVDGGLAIAVLFGVLETCAWTAGLWALLRLDAERLFTAAPPKQLPYSQWSIYGAISVGLSLPVPLSMIVADLPGRGGLTASDLWFSVSIAAMPALGGTLLGWLALNKIRESNGRVRGLPLAMFATLCWPLLVFGGLAIALPIFVLRQLGGPTLMQMPGRLLVLLLPSAVITLSFWTIHATARWASHQPAAHGARTMKWIFIGVLLIGMGVVMVDGTSKRLKDQNPATPSATTENWSPELAAGDQPDLDKIRQEAATLARQGRYEEALQRQLWYHNHALQYQPSLSGLRLTFALSQWTELARRYPKAKEALLEIRDRGANEFAQGGGYFELFMEVAAINRELGEQEATLALLKSIQARDPKLARQCYFVAEELLIEKGEYALCASFIKDFQERFERNRSTRERTLANLDRFPETNRAPLQESADRSFISSSRILIEILIGIGRKIEAESIRDQAISVLNVPEFLTAVEDARQAVEKFQGQPRLK